MLKFNAPVTTDVLVVGGGIGGLCAAIASAREGAKTLVAEKSDTRRSGSGATGNDHFACYYPKQHGEDIGVILKELRQSLVGAYHDEKLSLRFLEESLHVADLWHEWGINMKPFGDDYEFMGHAYPGRPRIWLKYDGHNQKQVLTRQARKEGVEILNHHPVADLIVANGEIAGALALDISRDEPSFTVIRAKKVILATGTANRLYPAAGSPGWPFNTAFCPACAGAAQAQGWRIGAKMVNMEMPNRHAGPKFFARAGKSTWIGVYRYPDGRLLGPFVDKPDRACGDITSDVWNSSFTDVMKNGRGPAYMDCSGLTPEDYDYMMWGMDSEGLKGMLNYMDEAGIDPRRHAVEFMQYEPFLIGKGLEIDEHGRCSVPGLYAAGDMVGNFRADIGGAAVFGWIAGEYAGSHIGENAAFSDAVVCALPHVAEVRVLCERIMNRVGGCPWKEGNLAVQQIMTDYAPSGPHTARSANLLNAGLKYLGDLRQTLLSSMSATCSHTLMRALETLDLVDVGEALMHAALERRETRPPHNRADFTFTNPMLGELFLTVRKEEGNIVKEWRKKDNSR